MTATDVDRPLMLAPAADLAPLGLAAFALTTFLLSADNASSSIVKVGGYVGVVTALVAWYASAAGVINGMRGSALVPVGKPFGMAPAS